VELGPGAEPLRADVAREGLVLGAPRGEEPAEELLRAVAAEIGISRAVEFLQHGHRRVLAILQG